MSVLKTSVTLMLAINRGVYSFTTPHQQPMSSVVNHMAADAEPVIEAEIDEIGEMSEMISEMSQSVPFMKRPQYLTGRLAGDVGFDPLGFVKSESDLMNYREAEIKHARLAMLAAAGWPLSEIFDKKNSRSPGYVTNA